MCLVEILIYTIKYYFIYLVWVKIFFLKWLFSLSGGNNREKRVLLALEVMLPTLVEEKVFTFPWIRFCNYTAFLFGQFIC